MVCLPSIISTISFFFFFGEIEGYDAVPAGVTKEVDQRSQDVKSCLDLLTETLNNSVKGADESVRIAVRSCSDTVTNLGDRLGECLDRDDQLIGLSTKLETSHGDDKMGSVWITIQVFSGISMFGILCALGLLGYITYQRSVIKQLLSTQVTSCANCMRFNNLAFDHMKINLSSIQSPPQSTRINNDTSVRGGGLSTPTSTPIPHGVEDPDSGNYSRSSRRHTMVDMQMGA